MMETSFEKYTHLNDPPVDGAPFHILVDEDKCIGCGLCVKQCPCQSIELVDRTYSSKQRPACQTDCPAGVDVRAYMAVLTQDGDFTRAWKIITQANPLPAVTGRVCPHTCEGACNRQAVDTPVNINGLERAVGDYGLEHNLGFDKPPLSLGKNVAVVGSGPSGISCAYHLARTGYNVTVFEAKDVPGGKLRDAIPAYRLPKDIIDREISRVLDLGIDIRYNIRLGQDITLETLRKDYHAVYVGVGAQKDSRLGLAEDTGPAILGGLDFLDQASQGKATSPGKKVVILGGGNTAVDAARTARRMGAGVTVAYRRARDQMPAYPHEVSQAEEEGVEFKFLVAPVGINGNQAGAGIVLTCSEMKLCPDDPGGRPRPVPVPGSEFTMAADTLITAVGLEVDPGGISSLMEGLGWIKTGPHGQTAMTGVFAGGDVGTAPGTVSQAIGMGRMSAMAIDAYLNGKALDPDSKLNISYKGMPMADLGAIDRNTAPLVPVDDRFNPLDREVALSLTPDQAMAESRRCLACGSQKSSFTGLPYFGKLCLACHNCEVVCPNQALEFPHFYRVNKGRWSTHFDYPKNGVTGFPNPFMEENTPDYDALASRITPTEKVIYRRRSVRMYTKDQVPREDIHRILEAGRFAPSAGNSQPWRFVVVRDRDFMDEMNRDVVAWSRKITRLYQGKHLIHRLIKGALGIFKPGAIDQRPMVAMQALNTPKFGTGKMDVFFGAQTSIFLLQNRLGISNPHFGAGICAQNMVLAAHAMGLGTCYVGFVSTGLNMDRTIGKYKKRLGVEWPFDYVATVLTVGYPAVQTDNVIRREFPRVTWMEKNDEAASKK
ncbi:MAG: FAD-dependent oxidoreductase [Desulfobacterium sp.]|nr:FAD-dependent oxidoreductase [Desulfobacterium sp.]